MWGWDLRNPGKVFALALAYLWVSSCGEQNLPVTRSLRVNIPIAWSATHIFVAPHPDDWQLFMGEYAYDLIRSADSKVVVITTDAGDDGLGADYWQAREKGNLGSVRNALGYSIFDGDPGEIADTVLLHGKTITHHTLRNVEMYSLRLPDGEINGEGTAPANWQSLLKLYRAKINSIQSIDKVNTFTLSELRAVLAGIIEREYTDRSQAVRFYIQDPGSEDNFSHSDHLVTELLAREQIGNYQYSPCKAIAFEDYRIKGKTINLSKGVAAKKVLLFSGYDSVMIHNVGVCSLCQKSHYDWLQRSYHKEYECAN